MPRPIQIRPSYDPDAAFLIRRMESMSLDTERHTEEWLRVAQEKFKEAAQHLLTAREDEAKKAKMLAESDRDLGKRAEQGRSKRAR